MDFGSYQIRSGFAEEEQPKTVVRSLIGKIKGTKLLPNELSNECLGMTEFPGAYNFRQIVKNGSFESIDDF